MRRGDIYLAALGSPVGHEQSGNRPVIILSSQSWLDSNPPVVTVVPMTRTRRDSSTHIEVEPGRSGLRATSYAKCEDLRAISPQRLGQKFGSADDVVMGKVDVVVRRLLGF